MAADPSVAEIHAAARGWLDAMRRLRMQRTAEGENPVRTWEEYTQADQQVLLRAAKAGLIAARNSATA